MMNVDVIVVGAGPAGLTAAIYCARAGKSTLVLEKEFIGGKITTTPVVKNIPGFSEISGLDFATKLYEQAIECGATFAVGENVVQINSREDGFIELKTDFDDTYECKACILATGTTNRKLGFDREDEFIGNGISFCTTCDGPFYKDKNVIVVGGGNSAVTEAIELATIASKVTLVQNMSTLTAEAALLDELSKYNNVETKTSVNITGYNIVNDELRGLTTEDGIIDADGVFLAIGLVPCNSNFINVVALDKQGFIDTSKAKNVFSCGDCKGDTFKQVAVACGSGATAAISTIRYLNQN